MIREILRNGAPVLRQPTAPVVTVDEAAALVADLIETAEACETPAVGLAAPQIGVGLRAFVWRVGVAFPWQVAINPEITDREGIQRDDEGCLSLPGVVRRKPRAWSVDVTWGDLDGVSHEGTAIAFEARIWQHEVDHLDGFLFIDNRAKRKVKR